MVFFAVDICAADCITSSLAGDGWHCYIVIYSLSGHF